MEPQSALILSPSEESLIRVVRKLPPERVAEVIDFAQFIEAQTTQRREADPAAEDETAAELSAEDGQWDRLLARRDAQHLMLEMARQALAEEGAGLTVEMAFDEDGNLIEPP